HPLARRQACARRDLGRGTGGAPGTRAAGANGAALLRPGRVGRIVSATRAGGAAVPRRNTAGAEGEPTRHLPPTRGEGARLAGTGASPCAGSVILRAQPL